MIGKKMIYAIDMVLAVGTIIALISMASYARPLVIAPIDHLETSSSSVLFEFRKGSSILIDDNIEFVSPEKINVENDLVINLKPGTYYWKIKGITESEIRTLTILSKVDLRLREKGDNIEVVNSGSEELDVEIYENGNVTGRMVLNVDESREAKGDLIRGEKNEK